MKDLPIWRRFQIEIGGRWQLMPDGQTSWREWAWSPYANVAWPGKLVSYLKIPREIWSHINLEAYADGKAAAKFWWATCALRVLGLDLGLAIFFRPKQVLP